MRGLKDKMIAAGSTVLFMAIINTNAEPRMWQIALITLALYEICLMTVKIARKRAYVVRKRKYIKVSRINAQRWADTKIGWPMREVI